jgi:xanthine/CO dehydrogenase XdhC/CoxF family maturation factor
LIAESGKRAGSISGGCLEEDVVKKAWWLSAKGPVVRRYDTTPDGEIGPTGELSGGFGLGCNGIIYLLIQRVQAGDQASSLAILESVYATRREAPLAHVLSPPESVGTFASLVTSLNANAEVFFETLVPPVRLLIFGAGDDAVPLTELARHLGWTVAIFDGRAHYARSERFPKAQQVSVRDSTLNLDDLQIDSRTAAVVMTHSYTQDFNFLKALAKHRLAYVGVLGPRNRSEQLLLDAGIEDVDMPFLHRPAGLDIGADGPEQVALSIIAEIQASFNGREGGPLRQRSGSIHSLEAVPPNESPTARTPAALACPVDVETDGRTAIPFVPGIVCA